jgi:hypothetical protein
VKEELLGSGVKGTRNGGCGASAAEGSRHCTHPATGRKALFVNCGFITRIVELSKAENAAVLAYLSSTPPLRSAGCLRWNNVIVNRWV